MLFLKTLVMMFAAEMGDKTQLFLVALASRYKLRHIVISVFAACLALNGIAVAVGVLLGDFIDVTKIKIVAGILFLAFAHSALFSKDEEEGEKTSMSKNAMIAIFLSFFVAELGDKTQLYAIAAAAGAKRSGAPAVFAACTIGLFAADMIGLLVGYLLKKNLPTKALSIMSFCIFAVFGLYTLGESVYIMSMCNIILTALVVGVAAVLFGIVCGISYLCVQANRSNKL